VRSVATLAELNAAITASAATGDTIRITADISLGTTPLTIAKGIKLTADVPTRKITCSATEGSGVTFSGDNVLVTGITIENTGTGSTATALNFSSATATNNYVYDATLTTNEFALGTNNAQIQIQNVAFTWTGSADSHRYINLQRTTGETFIVDCTFAGNGSATPNSRGIYSASAATKL
jgi:hypothetical protein